MLYIKWGDILKKHIVNIINIILIIIFLILVIMIIRDKKNSSKILKTKPKLEINYINFHEENGRQELTFSVNTDEKFKLSDYEYDMYILDSDDNLIYLKKKIVIKTDENYILNLKFIILDDISSYDKIIFVVSGEKVNYKKNSINNKNVTSVPTTKPPSIMQIN